MAPNWLRKLSKKLIPTSPPPYVKPKRPKVINLLDLQLEDRVTPATITWTNATGGAWNTLANWDLGRLPGAGDDVVIPDLGTIGTADLTITNASSSSQAFRSLTIWENLTSGSGVSMRLTGDLAINGGATFLVSNSYIDFEASSTATVQNVTTTGGGTIQLALGGDLAQFGTAHTVAFGSGVTVSALSVGNIGRSSAGRPSGAWANAGSWTVGSGGTLNIAGTWTNTGTINVTGGTLNLGGSFSTPSVNDPGRFTRTGGTAGTVNLTGTLNNTGQTLALTAVTGVWQLGVASGAFGQIVGGTVDAGASRLAFHNGALNNVTLAGSSGTVVAGIAGYLQIVGDLTLADGAELNMTAAAGVNALLHFNGAAGTTQRILTAGAATITLNRAILSHATANHTVEFGAGVTVRSVIGTIDNFNTTGTVSLPGTWRNAGTWTADGGSLTFGAFGTFESLPGGTWATGTGTLTTAGTWTNTGTINVTGGTLNLGGSFSTPSVNDPGRFTRTGGTAGTVNLTGTLTNTGNNLTLDTANNGIGTLRMSAGTIIGGTVTTASGAVLQSVANVNTLNGVTISAGSDLLVAGSNLIVVNGLTLNGRATLQPNSLVFNGTQTLGGSGEVVLGTGSNLYVNQQNMTLTLGPDILIRVAAGTSGNVTLGSATSPSTGTAIVNQGTIAVDSPGTSLIVGGTLASFTNAAPTTTPTATPGGRIQVSAGTLTINAASWTNSNTITAAGGSLNLSGGFTASSIDSLTRFNRTGGALNLTGTLNGDFQLNDVIGNVNFAGGTLKNGSFSIASGSTAKLFATTSSSFLDNYTLNDPIDMVTTPVSAGPSRLFILNGLTLNTTLPIGDESGTNGTYGAIQFNGTQTLGGTGTILFGTRASGAGTLQQQSTSDVLTIGSGITIVGTAASIGTVGSKLVNLGTIRRDRGAGQFTITFGPNGANAGTIDTTATTIAAGARTIVTAGSGNTFNNFGTISSASDTAIGFQTNESWNNYGNISITGGTLSLGGLLTQAKIGSLTRSGSNTVLLGSAATVSGPLLLDDSTGSWNINGGTLANGELRTNGSARLFVTGGTNTLNNYTLSGNLDISTSLPAGGATLNTIGTLTFNTVIQFGNTATGGSGLISVRDNQTWTGSGGFLFAPVLGSPQISSPSKQTLIIDPGVTLSAKSLTFSSMGSIVNRGTIEANSASSSGVTLNLVDKFNNLGTVRATNGGTLNLVGAALGNLTNAVATGTSFFTGTLTGGTWEVGASSRINLNNGGTAGGLSINKLDARVILDGGGSEFYGAISNAANSTHRLFDELAEITSNGSFELRNGRTWAFAGPLTSSGQITVANSASLTIDESRVTNWSADGNANDSFGGFNGTASAGVTYVQGRAGAGQAFFFDNSADVVTVPDHAAFRPGSFTISAWINPTTLAQANGAGVVVKEGTSGYSLKMTNTGLVSYTPTIGTGTALTASVPANAWTHIVGVYTEGYGRLYINGVEAGVGFFSNNVLNHSTNPLRIGQSQSGVGFLGAIDDVQFFDRALTPSQIAQLNSVNKLSFTQTDGVTEIRNASIFDDNTLTTLQGGVLKGTGSVRGDVSNTGGSVAPGNSPGILNITGNYTQGPNGTLDLEIGGRDPDIPEFDRLRVTGTATLDGTIRLTNINGFESAPGDTFRVLSAASRVGTFAKQDFPAPGGAGRQYKSAYDATGLTILTTKVPPLEFLGVTTASSMTPLDTAIDANGNTYVVGSFTGTVDFDPNNVLSYDTLTVDDTAGFVAKYDANNKLVWLGNWDVPTGINPGKNARVLSVAVDARGNANPGDDRVYIGAQFDQQAEYALNGSSQAAEIGNAANGVILWLDANGNFVESRRLGFNAVIVDSLAVQPNGNLVVSGSFDDLIILDEPANAFQLNSAGGAGDYDGFVAEYVPTTSPFTFGFTHVRSGRIGGAKNDVITSVSTDSLGNVWVGGTFSSAASTGLATFTNAGLAGSNDAFLLKLVPNGTGFTTAVAQAFGASGNDAGNSVAVDAAGNAYLGGGFQLTVDFDVLPSRSFALTSGGDQDAFMVKLDVNGGFLWARGFGGFRQDVLNDLAIDVDGNVYSTGTFTDRVDFDPLDGSYILQTNPTTNYQAFLLKLDAKGAFLWATALGDYPGAVSSGAALATDGERISSVGTFSNTVDFDPTDNQALRTGPGGYISFLKQKASPVVTISGLPVGSTSEGAQISAIARVVDPDSFRFLYSWSVLSGGSTVATGTGSSITFPANDQGFYTISVTVTDEVGNTGSATSAVAVVNAPPVLAPTAFGAGTNLFTGAAAAEAGTALASANGRVFIGSPGASANLGSVAIVPAVGGVAATLSNPNAAIGRFGSALTTVGPRLAVAATGRATDLNGVVHLFTESAGVYSVERSLSLTDGVLADGFGTAMTSIGNLLAVSAPGRGVNGVAAGAVYLYDATTGVLVRTILNPTPVVGDKFGAALASANGLLMVSAPGDDTAGLNAGTVYVFDPGNGQLVRVMTNPNPGFLNGEFGTTLAANGSLLAVGAPLDDSAGADAGGVYLYDLVSGVLLGTLRSPNAAPANGRFGSSLAFNGNRLAVGANGDGTTVANSGTLFVYDADAGSGTFRQLRHTLKKPMPTNGERFGAAVVANGDDWYASAATAGAAGTSWRFAATSFLTLSATAINENDLLTLSGSFSDAGQGDSHTLLVDWGMPGNTVTRVALAAGVNTFSVSNRYLDDNPTGTSIDTANIRVRVLDTQPDLLLYDGGANGYDRLVTIDGVTLVSKREIIPPAVNTQVLATAVNQDGDFFALRNPSLGVHQIDRYHGGTGEFLGTIVSDSVLAPLISGINLNADLMVIGPNQQIYLATDDRVVQFDSRTGTILSNTMLAGGDSARGLAFGPDGVLYAILAISQQVIRIDPASGAILGTYLNTSELPAVPIDLAFGENGVVYVAGSIGSSQLIRRFDFATKEALGDLISNRASTSVDSYVLIDGDTLIGGSGNDGYVTRYDLTTGIVLNETAATNAQFGGLLHPLDETTASVTVANLAPTVRITAARNDVGTYTLKALPADVGTLDPLTVGWKINGVAVAANADGTVTFNATNTSATTVVVTVNDDDLGVVTSTFTVIVGTGNADTITLGNTSANVNGTTLNYAAGTGRVVVYGLGGDDTINASGNTATPVELVGGTGNDTLIGGNFDDVLRGNNPDDYNPNAPYTTEDQGADSLVAGAGNDTLDGGLGNDSMIGGTGNDYYIQVSGSTDLLSESGSTGIDSIDLVYSYRGVTLSLAYDAGQVQTVDTQNHEVMLSGTFENVYGSGYGDVLSGNSVQNELRGGLGDDQLFGSDPLVVSVSGVSDDDSLSGGAGNDTVDGGSGNDIIFGTDALSILPTGVSDDDSIRGGSGNDTIDGGSGNDIIFGTDALAVLPTGVSDDDSIRGGSGNDTIDGGSGNDIIFGTDALTVLAAGVSDDDSIRGGSGNDTIDGGSGNDIIFGTDALATLPAGVSDDDSIRGGSGNDTIDGGSGNDIIFGTDALATLPAGVSDDDSIRGGSGNDTIDGGSGNDIIFGSTLLDTLPAGVSDDDSIRGGTGNDTIDGGSGNDIIFGTDALATLPAGVSDDDSIRGGTGNDTIDGGAGNDIIFGSNPLDTLPAGVSDDDSIRGGAGNDTIDGGSGNDIIFGTDALTILSAGVSDDDSIRGGAGNDTIDGGSGNDIIFGSTLLDTLPAGISDDDSIRGGAGNDTIDGGSGNDIIFGNQGDDQLVGGKGLDLFEGGSGNDRLVESVAGIVILDSAKLQVAGLPDERLYDIEEAQLFGGIGDDQIDASAFYGPVLLFGDAGNDTLIGGVFGDQLFGSSGQDSLDGGEGDDQLSPGSGNDLSDGGAGNDVYFMVPNGIDTIQDSQGIDTLDLSAATLGVTLDLNLAGVQSVDSSGNVLVFNGSIENVRGTSFADVLIGSADRNILEGGGGIDLVTGNNGADTVQGDFTQLVYLDFDSATGPNEYFYSIEDRNLIQSRLEQDYAFPFSIVFTQTRPSIGRYGTIVLNAGAPGSNEALIAGLASELDFRNVNTGSVALINANGFLGRRGQPAATSSNYVAFTSTLIAHELGHLLGLRHNDSFGPIGASTDGQSYGIFSGLPQRSRVVNEQITGNGTTTVQYVFGIPKPVAMTNPLALPAGSIYSNGLLVATFALQIGGGVTITSVQGATNSVLSATFTAESAATGGGVLSLVWSQPTASSSVVVSYSYEAFRPGYTGPTLATETPLHIMASPASVGTSVLDALGNPFFGERELIRLAFTNAGVTFNEGALATTTAPASLGGSARAIGELPALAVPNLLPLGTRNYGLNLNVRATSIIGGIQRTLGGTGPSENDVYAIQAKAGEFLTIEMLSSSLRQRMQPVDGIVRVYNSAGQLVNYYGSPAINDDGLDNQDPVLLDIPILADGTYYIEVDTYSGGPGNDTQAGGYELYLYSYTNPTAGGPRQGGIGDTVVGSAGNDILSGSAGDDDYRGTVTEDIILGATASDFVRATNTAPSISVQFNTTFPGTNDLLIATVTPVDPDGDLVYLTYVWRVNGVVVRTTGSTTTTTDTLDLSQLGNGNRGDLITVAIASNDRIEVGNSATASATVTNSAPTAAVILNTASPRTNDVLVATASGIDADGDPLSFVYRWYVNNVLVSGATSSTFDLAVQGNRGDVIRVEVEASDGTASSVTASASAVVANTAPTATVTLNTVSPFTNDVLVASASGSDADGDALSFVYRWYVNNVLVSGAGTNTFDLAVQGNRGDVIRVEVEAGDGTASSVTASASAVVANTAPTATVTLNTVSPRTNDVLVASASGSDADGDALSFVYRWYVNNVLVPGATSSTFDLAVQGNRGDVIRVEVEASDGTASSVTASASAVVANTAPTATVTLNTVSPFTNDVLVASASGSDADGDALSFVYRWYVNNVLVSGAGTNTFDLAVQGNRGDVIRVEVEAGDGTASSVTASASAVVANTAPTATVTLNTVSPRTNDVLVASASGSDADGDALSFVYRWYVNNVLVPGATSSTFDLAVQGNRGDVIRVEVEAGDGTASSVTASASAVVANTAPTATVTLNTVSPFTNDVLVASASGSDADGDALSFVYRWYVNNVLVSGAGTNTFDLAVQGNRGDVIRVEVEAGDGTASSVTASASAVVANTAPTATVTLNTVSPFTNDVLVASASGSDADGDALSFVYRWYVNNVLVSGAGTNTFDLAVQGNRGDVIRVEVEAGDGVGGSAVASASAVVASTPPVANDNTYTTNTNSPLVVSSPGLLGNDTDLDNDTLIVIGHTSPSFGTAVVGADGSFTYTPVIGFSGNDSFTYTISDGFGGIASATVFLAVQSNGGTLEVAITGTPTNVAEGTPITLGSAVTGGTGSIAYSWSAKLNNTVIATSTATNFNFTPLDNGSYTIQLSVMDASANTGVKTQTILVDNVAPTASVTRSGVATATSVDVTVGLANVIDPSTVDRAAGFRYSFATSADDLATSYTTAGSLAVTTFSFPTVLATRTIYLRVFDKDDGYTDSNLQVWIGSSGNDELIGGSGMDMLFGLGGDDTLRGGSGEDWLDGGEGNDLLRGGSGKDMLFGLGGDDTLRGGSGEDWLDGGEGNDWLKGGSGNDSLLGGTGNDILVAHNGGGDLIDGGDGDDTFWGWHGIFVDNTLIGGAGNDRIYNGDALGGDLILANWYPASDIEVLQGAACSNNGIRGDSGNNILNFGATRLSNILIIDGQSGNDTISATPLSSGILYTGGSGDDTLIGSSSTDRLDGGGGEDVFRFVCRNTSGEDQVNDFRRGRDKLDLRAFGVTWSAIQLVRSGNDLLVKVALPASMGGGFLTIRLKGFNGSLDATDFIF